STSPMENLGNPKTTAHDQGQQKLADMKNDGDLPLSRNLPKEPGALDLDGNATVAGSIIDVTGLRLGLGHSTLEASGRLKDPEGKGSLQFKTQLALGEIGRLANVALRPDGRVSLNGTASLDANQNYQVRGNLAA